jgi:hypothetical protein
MFGNKRLIAQYEARISDLHAQIADLRALVLPTRDPNGITALEIEADSIVSGKDEVIEVEDRELLETEASLILSGMHDQVDV